MSRITGPLHLQPGGFQNDEKELVLGIGVEVVPGRQGLEVIPGQRLPGRFSHVREHELPPRPEEPTILGMRRTTFALSIALVVIIIAGAIATGIEGNVAAQCAKTNNRLLTSQTSAALRTATITVTATKTAATGLADIASEAASTAALDTSNPSASISTSPTSTLPDLVRPTVGLLALDCPNLGKQLQNVTIGGFTWSFKSDCGADYSGHDVVGIISYSYEDCLQACVMYNIFYGDNQCTTVHFVANMTWALPVNFANCWLKNGTDPDPARQQGNLVVTALLTNVTSGEEAA